MAKRKRISEISGEVRAEIARMYQLGVPMKYISLLSDVSRHHVKEILKADGLYVNKYPKPAQPPDSIN